MKHIKVQKITPDALPHLAGSGAEQDALRQLRAPLLAAFDIYKSNVFYGIIAESERERGEILTWYRALLDKEPWALTTIPQMVRPYVGGNV